MESLLAWFAHIPTAHRAALIGAGFTALFALELAFGATRFARARHARTNLAFWATTLLVNAALSGATLGASFAVSGAGFGLLRAIALPTWLELLLTIAGMDLLTAYVHHSLAHHVPLLWKFHVVHHSDPHVDSTTALRHSPVEAVMRGGMTLLGVVILGVSPGPLVAYQTIALLAAQWIHADLRLPAWLDRRTRLRARLAGDAPHPPPRAPARDRHELQHGLLALGPACSARSRRRAAGPCGSASTWCRSARSASAARCG
jgi:sterol desaturase/sphingolipid hydroxylase (fatty acid hydroxylase superfamily)